eukprot:scaffold15_cov204-Amphora_coffeaeformis.AAC.11
MVSEILIEDFASPTHKWEAKNDPVMGGKSKGTVSIEHGLGIFDGEVVDVPFLQAPGFITMETRGGLYPDVSSCQGLIIKMRATHPYDGYRISFGTVHVPGGRFAYGYKADFEAPLDVFHEVYVPFGDFTAKWDDATGDAIVTCEQDAQYCPTVDSLRNLQTMSFWGEGKKGQVHLEIMSISGAQCSSTDSSLSSLASESAALVPPPPPPAATSGSGSNSNNWKTVPSWMSVPVALVALVALVGLLSMLRNRLSVSTRHQPSKDYTTVQQAEEENPTAAVEA